MSPLLTLLLPIPSTAQTCHYPNGDLTTVDAPCPNSDLCCPLNWQCLSNGLCYDPTNDYYERRTCADSTWQSEDCPNFCTYSEGGNEAILLCSSGEYCCDGNRVSFDCCDGTLPPGTDYFELPDGNVVGSITALSPASTSSGRASSSSSSSSATKSTTSTQSSSTLTSSSTTSSSSNSTAVGDPISQPERHIHDQGPLNLGAIIGLAIGLSILIVLGGILLFYFYRRYKKSRIATMATYNHTPSSPGDIKYTHAPEIGGSPKAATDGMSELPGSEPHARNSTVSSLTTAAQGYSPKSVVSPVVPNGEGGGWGGGVGRMGQIQEKDEPAPVELGGELVYYQPYRPGLEHKSPAGFKTPPDGFGGTSEVDCGNVRAYSGI